MEELWASTTVIVGTTAMMTGGAVLMTSGNPLGWVFVVVGAILTVFGLLGSIVSAPIRQWNARRSAGAVSMEDQLDKGNTVYADVQFVTTGNRNHDLMPTCGGQGLIRVTVSEPVRYVFEYRDREAVKIVCPRGTPRLKAMTAIGIVIDEGRNRGELVKMEFRYNVAAYRGGN